MFGNFNFAKCLSLLLLLFPYSAFVLAESNSENTHLIQDLTQSWVGYLCITIFVIAYCVVILEEKLRLRKSKSVLLSAGLIWLIIAIQYIGQDSKLVETAIRHNLLEYAELFFFLLVAMTYINAMIERGVFEELRRWLVSKNFSYRQMFWMTGIIAFFLSPIADNLTTALIMCAVIMTIGEGKPKFVSIACINVVVAANAGGAFSPFGDITTLMVWQKGEIEFWNFFNLFLPSLVNFVIPAAIMQFAVERGTPTTTSEIISQLKIGGYTIVVLFLLTIATAVTFHNFLHLPPVIGMMLGLAYLKFYGYSLRVRSPNWTRETENPPGGSDDPYDFDVFRKIARSEWDTLFFFYGVILSVGGLSFLGYLSLASGFMYDTLGTTNANILVGLLSAVIDNIPVMFAVLTMDPQMSNWQWLLVTLTAGVGGSLLSIGSAAGVALMGQARGMYTFFGHLKWAPVISLGYAASIYTHYLVNS